MHIRMLIKSQSEVCLHIRCGVHFHPSPFTRPSFLMSRGSCSESRAVLGLITFLKTLSISRHRHAIYAVLKQKLYNFTTNTLKAYLSAKVSSLTAFVISKTHISGQKPRGRQLNSKVCDSESTIFRILLSFLLRPLCSTTISRKRFKYSSSL